MPLNKIVGLDFGSANIRAIEVELNKDGSIKKIEKIAQLRIPTQIISNGSVVSEQSLTASLIELFKRHDIKTKDVVVSINGETIVTRTISHVESEKNESIFLKALPFKLKDSVPIELSDNHLGSHTLKEYVDEDTNKLYRDILLVAIEKNNMNTILKAVHAAELKPRVVDVAPLGILRAALKSIDEPDNKRIACVDVGADVTTIIIYHEKEPEYIRTITGLGGNIINSRISDELHIPTSEAEREKFKALTQSNSIAQTSTSVFGNATVGTIEPGTNEARIAQAINMIVAQEVSVIITGIRDTFTDAITFHGSAVNSPIEKIVLSGAGSGVNTLASRLKNELDVPVEYINPFKNVTDKALLSRIENGEIIPHTFATAFGSVVREVW